MKNYIIFSLLVVSCLVPAISSALSAEINYADDITPQIGNCLSLKNNLKHQSRDVNTNGEVSALQNFLSTKVYLGSNPTGYFGLKTLAAVKSFQTSVAISPTGYVGPLTRSMIARMTCSQNNIEPSYIDTTYKETSTTKLSSKEKTVTYTYENSPCGSLMSAYSTSGSVFVGNGPVLAIAKEACTSGTAPDTSSFRTYSCSNSMQNNIMAGTATFAFTCMEPLSDVQLQAQQNVETDVLIKENLNNARAQAELYWDANPSREYQGVCTQNGGVSNLLLSAATKLSATNTVGSQSQSFKYKPYGGSGSVVCHDSKTAWAAMVSLKSPSTSNAGWCVDSSGSSREATSLGRSATICP